VSVRLRLHPARLALSCGALLVMTSQPGEANAQLRVHVRASSRLELRVSLQAKGAEVSGALIDDAGEPLAGRAVEVALRGEAAREFRPRSLRTRKDGTFRLQVAVPAARGVAEARFDGDAHHEPSEGTQTFDLQKLETQLRFVEPRDLRVDLGDEGQALVVAASSEAFAGGLEITIEDEGGRLIARGISGDDGVFRASLPAARLGPPGLGRLFAKTYGDGLRAAAQAEIQVLRYEQSRLSLQTGVDRDRGRLLLSGSLRDRHGALADRAVGLFDQERHLATVVTDDKGGFRHAVLQLPEPGSPPLDLALQARFESDATWLTSSRSSTVTLRLQPEPSANASWLLVPIAACALLLWLLGRKEVPRDARTLRDEPSEPGLHRARPLRHHARADFDVTGRVVDHEFETGLSGAKVRLDNELHASGPAICIELETDARGGFRSPALTPGRFTLHVSADGYVPLEDVLTVPHRGELSDLRVRLQNRRAAAFVAYKPVAARALPAAELWGRWTPRETLDYAVRHRGAGAELAQLTAHLERAAYARTPPSQQDLALIRRAADAIAHAASLAPQAPAPSAHDLRPNADDGEPPPPTRIPGPR
jgi:hypothetical protein